MSQNPDHSPHVRRVVLPSGRAIEVVYFEPQRPLPEHTPAPEAPGVDQDLQVCPRCPADLVYPIDWEEVSATQWEVQLRCPNCEWSHVGTYPQDVVDRFDDELDQGTDTLARDLRQLTRANMEEELARFTSALNADAIWPIDF
ncbi:MAG: hypothetical protein H0V22_10255 [Solirubrobacterales bacterium]|jgi:hypothetical protein|nr:hypothetical protein [Solirubrobacterales bacterium]